MTRPLMPEDAQAAPGYYALPDDVLVHVVATKSGRTVALRYWPDAPPEAGPPERILSLVDKLNPNGKGPLALTLREAAKQIPAGRIGVDEDMAAAAIYLAARAGDYVVGETITVDGGLVNASMGGSIDG